MDLRQRLRDFIIEDFLFGDQTLLTDDSSSLMDAGIVDSVGVMEITAFLEKELNVTVEDDDLTPENFDSIDGLHAFVRKKQTAGAARA